MHFTLHSWPSTSILIMTVSEEIISRISWMKKWYASIILVESTFLKNKLVTNNNKLVTNNNKFCCLLGGNVQLQKNKVFEISNPYILAARWCTILIFET